jgi:hypothetical protein
MSLRAPRGLPEAMEFAARQQHTVPAEYCRRAILGALEADGLNLRNPRRRSSRVSTNTDQTAFPATQRVTRGRKPSSWVSRRPDGKRLS